MENNQLRITNWGYCLNQDLQDWRINRNNQLGIGNYELRIGEIV